MVDVLVPDGVAAELALPDGRVQHVLSGHHSYVSGDAKAMLADRRQRRFRVPGMNGEHAPRCAAFLPRRLAVGHVGDRYLGCRHVPFRVPQPPQTQLQSQSEAES